MPTIADIIQQTAAQYGLPADYLMRTAHIESRMNPAAANPNSSAKGLFQFIDSTWGQYGRGGDPRDPRANTDAMARFTIDNRNRFRQTMGRDPTPGEMYLMHQQGAGGALKLLQNASAPAASVVGEDAIRLNAGQPNMTAGDFANLWMKKFGGGVPSPAQGAAPAVPAQGSEPVAAPAPSQPDTLGPLMAQLMATQPIAPEPEKPAEKPKKRKEDGIAQIFANASPNLVLA